MEMDFYVQKKHTMVRISFALVYLSCCKQFKWFLKFRTNVASAKSNPTREQSKRAKQVVINGGGIRDNPVAECG